MRRASGSSARWPPTARLRAPRPSRARRRAARRRSRRRGGAVANCAASAGARLRSSGRRLDVAASNCWTNSSPCPPMTAAATSPSAAAPAASKASEDMPRKLGAPADREPVSGGDRDADAGEASRPNADQDCGRLRGRRAARRSSAPAARNGRGRSVRRARATQAPSPSNRAAVQAALDVSNARSMERIVVTCGSTPQVPELHRFDAIRLRERSDGSGSRSRA